MSIPQYPNDRDYFIDDKGDIYQVLGYVHPTDSIYCLKKYIKLEPTEIVQKQNDNFFLWHSNLTDFHYERIITNYSSKSAKENISNSKYRKYSELYDCDFIQFPRGEITRYFIPNVKLKALRASFKERLFEVINQMTDQEKYAIELSYLFEEELGISIDDIGVTGSMLWEGIHKHSDIDMIIYGIENAKKFIRASEKLISSDNRIRRPNTSELFALGGKFSQKTGLTTEDCVVYTSLKKYLLYFGKYYLSIAFSPKNGEIQNNGMAIKETKFKNISGLENLTIKAVISDLDWGFFYPSIVNIKNANILNGSSSGEATNTQNKLKGINICRIVIFERECSGYYYVGQNIEIRGLVQEIENPPPSLILKNALGSSKMAEEGAKFHQMVIGTSENFGNEYIKNLDI